MADVHVYVNRPAGKEGTDLEDLEEALRKLEYVSEVEERAVEEAGYKVSRISVRTIFSEE